MTQEEINRRKAEINEESQMVKDRYIDDIRTLTNKFNQDWTRLMNFQNNLSEEERKQDKVNK